jgi:hypothetical protein
LCRFHHGQKTDRLLPKAVVEEANRKPFNLTTGASSPLLLHYSGDEVDLIIGGNSLNIQNLRDEERFYPLIIDQMPIVEFRFQQGRLYLGFRLFDEANNLVLKVKDNEIVFDSGQWDVEWVGRTVIIRQALGRIFLKVKFSPPGLVVIERGTVQYNGVEILIGKNYLYNSNNSIFLRNVSVTNSNVCVSFGTSPENLSSILSFPVIRRDIVDKLAARAKLRKVLSESRCNSPVEERGTSNT